MKNLCAKYLSKPVKKGPLVLGGPGACSPVKILIKMVRSGAIWAFQSMLLLS